MFTMALFNIWGKGIDSFCFIVKLDVQPTESERPVWQLVKSVLDSAQEIIMELQRYSGATEEIRMVRAVSDKHSN